MDGKSGLRFLGIEIVIILVIILVVAGILFWIKVLPHPEKLISKPSAQSLNNYPSRLQKDSLLYNLITSNPVIVGTQSTIILNGVVKSLQTQNNITTVKVGDPPVTVLLSNDSKVNVKNTSGGSSYITASNLKEGAVATITAQYDLKNDRWIINSSPISTSSAVNK